jgi:S1-C subfamily serine protease
LLAAFLALATRLSFTWATRDTRSDATQIAPDPVASAVPAPVPSQPVIPPSKPVDPPAAESLTAPATPAIRESTPMTTTEILARAESGVALIKGQLGRGTGFLVRGGVLTTNAHVIGQELMRSLEIRFPSAPPRAQGSLRARLLYEDSRRDIALLKLETDLSPLKMARSYQFRRGEDITIIGNPGIGGDVTLQNAVTRGILSTETTLKGQRFYQLGASVNPGNSGGPAIDSHGDVIGIVTAKAREEEAISFCIPVEDLTKAMNGLESADDGRLARCEKRHNLGAVFRRLRKVCQTYSSALETYAATMKRVMELGGKPDDGIRAAFQVIGDQPLSFDRALIDAEVKSEMTRLLQDLDVGADLRSDFRDLWSAYIDLRSYVAQPRGPVQNFFVTVIQLKDRLEHALKGIEVGLGIEE